MYALAILVYTQMLDPVPYFIENDSEVLSLLLSKCLVRNQVIHHHILEILISSTPHIQALRKLRSRPVDDQWGVTVENQQRLLRCDMPPEKLLLIVARIVSIRKTDDTDPRRVRVANTLARRILRKVMLSSNL